MKETDRRGWQTCKRLVSPSGNTYMVPDFRRRREEDDVCRMRRDMVSLLAYVDLSV
jgi:hypothetical protein